MVFAAGEVAAAACSPGLRYGCGFCRERGAVPAHPVCGRRAFRHRHHRSRHTGIGRAAFTHLGVCLAAMVVARHRVRAGGLGRPAPALLTIRRTGSAHRLQPGSQFACQVGRGGVLDRLVLFVARDHVTVDFNPDSWCSRNLHQAVLHGNRTENQVLPKWMGRLVVLQHRFDGLQGKRRRR